MLLVSTDRGKSKLAFPWDTYSSSKNVFLHFEDEVSEVCDRVGAMCAVQSMGTIECWEGSAKRLQTALLPQEQPRKLCKIHTDLQDAME